MAPLPLEVWREIFTLACTDGGQTAAALVLTCRFFYHAVHPARFQSLAFTSLHQVERFLVYVDHLEENQWVTRPRVYHLLLSFTFFPDASQAPSPMGNRPPDERTNNVDQWITTRRQREQEQATWDEDFLCLIPALFDFVAPHLRTLALLQSDRFALPAITPTLPRLRELTLLTGISVMLRECDAFDDTTGRSTASSISAGPSPSTSDTDSSATPSCPYARFPALKRLHVVCGRLRDYTLRDALAPLPRLAPALTHLRISNATYTHERCIPAFLCAALGLGVRAPSHDHIQNPGLAPASPKCVLLQQGSGRNPALPGLKHVVVHSVVPPSDGVRGSPGPYTEHVALLDAVNAVRKACDAAADAGAGVRVRSMCSDRAKQRYWEQLVEKQWVDRIEGGNGCWVGCEDG
ncbi:hypothetical protein BD413DRAFT_493408 [Trametes elegans]|nr:hypothetical protein BD413DRAFT_493408 [Trametes elegans]